MKLQNSHAYVGTKGTLYYHISSYSRNGELGLLTNQKPHSFVMQLLPCNCFLLLFINLFDIMQLATQNQHATKPYYCYCCTVMRLATQLHPWSCCPAKYHTCSCCHAECHTASNMQLLPCRMPHSFTHAAVAMQNATQLQTCSCCHAECHTASNMQLLPCRMPHSFKHAAVAMQNAAQLQTCSCYYTECCTTTPSSCCCHTVALGHSASPCIAMQSCSISMQLWDTYLASP